MIVTRSQQQFQIWFNELQKSHISYSGSLVKNPGFPMLPAAGDDPVTNLFYITVVGPCIMKEKFDQQKVNCKLPVSET